MSKEDTLIWFNDVARDAIEDNHGLFSTFYYVYDVENDPYYFKIEYIPYRCNVETDNGCDDCPFRTMHGNCGEYSLCINDDGSIWYEGTDKTYTDSEFDNLLNDIF